MGLNKNWFQAWRYICRCRSFPPIPTTNFSKTLNTGAVFWIGACSTWNQIFPIFGLVISGYFTSATPR